MTQRYSQATQLKGPQEQQQLAGRPTHADVEKLSDAMRRANEFSEAGGTPEKAVALWVDPDMLLVDARVSQKGRFGGELPKDQNLVVFSHSSFMYGFTTARLFLEPHRSLTAANRTSKAANPFLKAGNSPKREELTQLMGKFAAGPDLYAARTGVGQLLDGVTDGETWAARIGTLVDFASLNWVASQAAMVANGVVYASDLQRIMADPATRTRFVECQIMFIDGFLLGMHFPTRE